MEREDKLTNATVQISRVSQRLTAIGALFVVIAFLGAIWQLFSIEIQLQKKRQELVVLRSEADRMAAEVKTVKGQLIRFRQLNQQFNDAVRYQTDRDYATSVEKLLEILQEDPNNEAALYWLARGYSKLGQYRLAIEYASKAIGIDPSYIDPYAIMVYSLNYYGRPDLAVQYLRKALDISIDAYPYFTGRTRDLEPLWNVKLYRDVFLAHERKIRQIQTELKSRGMYSGQVDGLVGSRTRSAINQFCLSQNITNAIPVSLLMEKLKSGQ